MSQFGPVSAWLVVGGCNVTGDIYDMTESAEQVLEECHPFMSGAIDNWDKYAPVGIAKMGLDCGQGLYDTRTAGMLQAFQSSGQTRQLVNFGFAGAGDPVTNVPKACVMVDGTYAASFTRKAQRGNLTMAQAKHTLSGVRYPGKVVAGLVQRTGNGDTKTSLYADYGAGSYGHGIFDLSVVDITGSPTNVTFTISSSTDHSAWNLEGTFTAVTVAGTAQRLLVTSTIDRYLAATWTFTGGSSPKVTALMSAYLYA